MGILATHAVLLLLVVLLRRNSTFMGVVFFGIGGCLPTTLPPRPHAARHLPPCPEGCCSGVPW
jgi:hypothetical protein